ncbi:helix-turn-helix transcriptional regulator [Burkholderia gladioli]|uniref:helix-turn-helix transcriptional regulator n=1 Tax=Burkholderia gladioli TaxID=28095 RepID=UPI00163E3E44|nr:transcriptional regulator [Burkholderia gladioli]
MTASHSQCVSSNVDIDGKPDIARVRIETVAALLACSTSTVRRRIRAGTVPPPLREGGALVWRVGDLRRALA